MFKLVVGVVVSLKKEIQLTARGVGSGRENPHRVQYVFLRTPEDLKRTHSDIILSKITSKMEPELVSELTSGNYRHVVDPSLQKLFGDRILIQERIKGICKVPDYLIIDDQTDQEAIELFIQKRGRVILKHRQAFGHETAHSMCVGDSLSEVWNFMGGSEILLMQQFIEHSGVLLKVFVIADHVSVNVRNSLRSDFSGTFNSQYFFDSSVPSVSIPENLIEQAGNVARKIALELKVPLLGVDIVIDHTTSDLVVVDLNYFPSYAELGSSFVSHLEELCLSESSPTL